MGDFVRRLRRSLVTVVEAEDGFPLVVFIGREGSRVHGQGATQISHEGRGLSALEFSTVYTLIIPRTLIPLHEAGQLAWDVGGLVLSAEAEIFDFSFVRLAQLVDLLARDGICSADRVGDALQAVQVDEVLIWVRPRDRVSYPWTLC